MNGTDTQRSVSHSDESLPALIHLGVVMRFKRWSSVHGVSVRALEHRQGKTNDDPERYLFSFSGKYRRN